MRVHLTGNIYMIEMSFHFTICTFLKFIWIHKQ